ncbi:MAG: hypothetical protein LBH43_05175, partial [Treponema sp.]|nr:hypothetical protein [Treponema sp.]
MDIQTTLTGLWEKYGQDLLGFGRKLLIAALIIIAGKIIIHLTRRRTDRAGKSKFNADATLV